MFAFLTLERTLLAATAVQLFYSFGQDDEPGEEQRVRSDHHAPLAEIV